ncbi:MAG TPA: alpha-amylase family glycosyl hydrolase [Terriglobia bacterium]|nr:alpha-amylase family glycosyl hydrolase [Terriglobia bacterium]
MTIGTNHPQHGAFSPVEPATWRDARFPLGARVAGDVTTFAVYSRNAERVLLEIYESPMGSPARFDYWLERGGDDVWRGELRAAPPGTYYSYRCWGPNWPFRETWERGNSRAGFISDVDAEGNRFNPNKALFDPYARELSHDRETPVMKETWRHNGGMYGSGPDPYRGDRDLLPPVTRREFDTGPWAPKSVVVSDTTSTGLKPRVLQKDAAIYEVHLRGMTRHPSASRLTSILQDIPGFENVVDVPEALRGTYAGAGFMAKYLKALGYTAVEFLPVHEFANDLNPEGSPGWDRTLDEPPHGNYWGYMTYGFFAPDKRYAHDRLPGGPTREFKNMVRAFHDEGLEVYLDVVYNHTGEGGLWDQVLVETAEILCLRGFDNAEYYALTGNNAYYWDSTGCGNNLDARKEPVRRLIRDSLEYWSAEMGVDGFRFDLATVLGRTGANHDFESRGRLLGDIAEMAEAEQIEVIAEAWDLGGSHVGDFPAGWAEWNGIYRDAVRRFMKGDPCIAEFVRAVNGDFEHFHDQGGPHKSVNFITAHDGFTLLDLVSYNTKNNEASWPFGPSDGGADPNLSWDSGGDHALRRARLRNLLTVQFMSRGVPMTLGGDEFGRTQNGNNNPYKIDSIGMWLNYDMITTPAPTAAPTGGSGAYHDNYGRDDSPTGKNGLFLFTGFLTQLRRAHPCLRQAEFADLVLDSGADVTYWFKSANGVSEFLPESRCLHWRIDGSAIGGADFLLLVNMWHQSALFTIPPPRSGRHWLRLIDTAPWAEAAGNFWMPDQADVMGRDYWVNPYSVVVLTEASHA